MHIKRLNRMILVVIFLVACTVSILHWPSIGANALTFYDEAYLTANPLILHPGISSAVRFMTEMQNPSTVSGYYQPLTMISLMLDYAIAGQSANLAVFHITSLLFHVFNTILIILLCYMLFGKPWAAGLVGLIQGIHPMTVESITWISERKTVLAMCFVLLSIILYLHYTRKPKPIIYWASVLFFILSLLAKPTVVALPLVLMLLDYWPLGSIQRPYGSLIWRRFIQKAPYFVVSVLFAAITLISQSHASLDVSIQRSLITAPLIMCYDLIFYLHKIILPLHLTSHYPIPIPVVWSNPVVMLSVICTCILIAALFLSLRWTKALFTGAAIFFVSIFPTMGIIGFSNVLTSDKYAYFPSIGFLLILGWLFSRISGKVSADQRLGRACRIGSIGVNVFIIFFSMQSLSYTKVWKMTESLVQYQLKFAEDDPVMQNQMGYVLYHDNQYEEAMTHLNKAISISPQYYLQYNVLGAILFKQGKFVEAVKYLKKCVEIKPDFVECIGNLGEALNSEGKYEEAIPVLEKAIQINPNDFKDYNNLGEALVATGKSDEAINDFNQSIRMGPYDKMAYNNLAVIYANQGKTGQSIALFKKVIVMDPMDLNANYILGQIYENLGTTDEALKLYTKVLQMYPQHTELQSKIDALKRTP